MQKINLLFTIHQGNITFLLIFAQFTNSTMEEDVIGHFGTIYIKKNIILTSIWSSGQQSPSTS
jgi:hypothetical protein